MAEYEITRTDNLSGELKREVVDGNNCWVEEGVLYLEGLDGCMLRAIAKGQWIEFKRLSVKTEPEEEKNE